MLQRIIDMNIHHVLYGAYMLKDENKGRLFINNAPPSWDFSTIWLRLVVCDFLDVDMCSGYGVH